MLNSLRFPDLRIARLTFFVLFWLILGNAGPFVGFSTQVFGQAKDLGSSQLDLAKKIDPRAFGFNIPPGQISAGGESVIVNSGETEVIAKVYLKVGENYIILLPDGKLESRMANEVKTTQKSFKSGDMKEIAKELIAREFKGFKVRLSQRYMFIYNTSEEFAAVTNVIMDSMLRGVILNSRAQGIKVDYPETPLIVVMFRSEAEFQRYKKMPPGVVAFYDILSNRVILHEESNLSSIDRKLAVRQSLSVIAHEGAHQILHNIGVQKRLSIWPMWLSEGLAEYYAPTEAGRGLKWRGAGQINDFRMFELENYLSSKTENVVDGSTIRDTVMAGRLTSTGYASAWSLTHFLAKTQKKEFNRFVREMSSLGALEGFPKLRDKPTVPENRTIFESYFGKDWESTEKDLVSHLKRQRYVSPFSEFPHYVAVVVYSPTEGKRLQRAVRTFVNNQDANAWRIEFIRSLDREIQPSVKSNIKKFRNRSAANLYSSQFNN